MQVLQTMRAASEGLEPPLVPFVKWPGGKRWAAKRIADVVTAGLSGTYFEPFLGSAAVYFHILPRKSVLADINEELISTYRTVRDNPAGVMKTLRSLPVAEQEYYRIREKDLRRPIERAARFLYLNRTAFGGIYRLNMMGKFNVPYGGGERTPEVLWKTDILDMASRALRKARLKISDFEPMIEQAVRGDVVYCDPTYTVAHENNGFIRYNERNFSWSDQERLAKAAFRARRRGALVIVSNAHHRCIKQLYRGATFETISRVSTVTPNSELRRRVSELLIRLEPQPR